MDNESLRKWKDGPSLEGEVRLGPTTVGLEWSALFCLIIFKSVLKGGRKPRGKRHGRRQMITVKLKSYRGKIRILIGTR